MSVEDGLKRSLPENQGVCSGTISQLLDHFAEKELELHSIMLLRYGQVVAEGWWEPYRAERPHMLFSLSKSFTSTAIGFAVDEGLISVEDKVCHFFPEEQPARIGPNLERMQIHHLLSMATGHEEDPTERVIQASDGDWVRAFLSLDVPREPGTHFVYNTAATYMLAAILHKVTGQSLVDYLTPRLFNPLGIVDATWETCPKGINTGGFGLSIKTADIAKFGQLYLQKGAWRGVQLISPEWIDAATKKQISNGEDPLSDWNQGYGYQFWRCQHGAYRADGAFGQFCIVVPKEELVVAITAGLNDMQGVLNGVWEILLPALSPAALPENKAGYAVLQRKLSELVLPPLPSDKRSGAAGLSGHYLFADNDLQLEAATLTLEADACHVQLELPFGQPRITCGYGSYLQSKLSHRGQDVTAFSCASWKNDTTLEFLSRIVETPFAYKVTALFTAGQVELAIQVNCGFGPREFVLHGKLETAED